MYLSSKVEKTPILVDILNQTLRKKTESIASCLFIISTKLKAS